MELDASVLPNNLRKKTIFKHLEELGPGEKINILNSHDMNPLLKLLDKENPGQYKWEYIMEGPVDWQICITKKSFDQYTVEELVSFNPSLIFLLHKYGIDFYIHCNIRLSNLFLNKREKIENVIDEASEYKSELFNSIRPESWSVEFIINYIIENHHAYINKKFPEISKIIHHLDDNFGGEVPKIQRLKERFDQFIAEMTEHFKEEENTIFPSLINILSKDYSVETKKEQINKEINWMKEDHFLIGDNINALRKICDNYILEETDIPGIKLVYQELQELEKDFLVHILLENQFLPKSIYRHISVV